MFTFKRRKPVPTAHNTWPHRIEPCWECVKDQTNADAAEIRNPCSVSKHAMAWTGGTVERDAFRRQITATGRRVIRG